MPVIQIKALRQTKGDPTGILKRLCPEIAQIMGVPPHAVFGTWETIPDNHFCEGTNPADQQPASTHPPIVQLVAFEGRSPETIEKALTTIADTLCSELGLKPGNAFVYFNEARSGQVYTGGQIRKRPPT